MECVRCGASAEKVRLFDAISLSGIVKICEECISKENIPLVGRSNPQTENNGEKKLTVYERLSCLAGINAEQHKRKVSGVDCRKEAPSKKHEAVLKEIAERNFIKKVKTVDHPSGLINNFHWVIMRARRAKKITQKELAEALSETEMAIRLAEQGILPDNHYGFINKIESYLGIQITDVGNVQRGSNSLFYSPSTESQPEDSKKSPEISFDPMTTKSLTISDLRGMKEKGEEIFSFEEKAPESPKKAEEKSSSRFSGKRDLSKEEIDAILFGKG